MNRKDLENENKERNNKFEIGDNVSEILFWIIIGTVVIVNIIFG